jgi:hypothetical protein
MKTSMLMASAVIALCFAGGAAAAASAPASYHAGTKAHRVKSPNRGLQVLYDQSGNDFGSAVVSQDFETDFDSYDAELADDFTVPDGPIWRVKEIDVTGQYFSGSGPVRSVNVIFYSDKSGVPGKVVHEFDNRKVIDNTGSFAIALPKAIWMKPGRYWVSVVANMDFTTGGEWGWETQTTSQGGAALWQNPGGGFGSCTTWGTTGNCVSNGAGDLMFTLRGFLYKSRK